jgi:hypothetical protein
LLKENKKLYKSSMEDSVFIVFKRYEYVSKYIFLYSLIFFEDSEILFKTIELNFRISLRLKERVDENC